MMPFAIALRPIKVQLDLPPLGQSFEHKRLAATAMAKMEA